MATRKAGGRPSILVSLLLITLAGSALGYAWYLTYVKPGQKQTAEAEEEFSTARTAPNLTIEVPSAPKDNLLKLPPPAQEPTVPATEAAVAPPVINVAPPPPVQAVDDGEAKRLAELERLRKEAAAKHLARLQSNMIVVDGQVQTGGVPASAAGTPIIGGGSDREEDPNRRFLSNTAAQAVELVQATQNSRTDALIPQGTMIRGVLETAIQSDLPGMVRAVISTDVWSFDGRRILLPKGTMLTGEYKSGLSRGQTRILIVWTRALRADGVSVALGSYGTDDLGRSGVTGDVDRHYWERFGSAAVLSLVGGVSSFIAGLNSSGGQQNAQASGGSSIQQDAQSQAQQTISQTLSDMANQALRESINIPPTIHVDQGTQIIVFVRRDLDFSGLYTDPVKEALYELRHPKPVAPRPRQSNDVGRAADLPPAGGQSDQTMVTKP